MCKKKIIIGLLFIILSTSVYSFLQVDYSPRSEPANLTLSAGLNKSIDIRIPYESRYNNITLKIEGFSTGNYLDNLFGFDTFYQNQFGDTVFPMSNSVDGNLATYGQDQFGGAAVLIFINKSVPDNILPGSQLSILTNNNGGCLASGLVYENRTLPNNCIGTNVSFRVYIENNLPPEYNVSCYDYTNNGYLTLYNSTESNACRYRIYEFITKWNKTGYPENLDIYTGGIYHGRIDGVLNYTANFSLNTDEINDLMDNGCNCVNCTIIEDHCILPNTFNSDSNGIIGTSVKNGSYYKQSCLIDEIDNTLFDINNVTSARVYDDINSTFFDYKVQSTNCTNLTLLNNKLRYEFIYGDGGVITRYIDTDLMPFDMSICINKDGVTHLEQLVQSSTIRAAILKSVFANCYVASDYTRFGFQNTYILKAYTIDTEYDVRIIEDGTEALLVGIDGSVSSFINLDTIEISQTPYNLDILTDDLTFEKFGNTTLKIFYNNLANDNTAVELTITRMDTNEQVFNEKVFDNINQFTIFYDYSSLTGVNATTIFQLELTRTNSEGTSEIKRYVNTFAQSSLIPSAIAMTAAILLTIFGLTFTVSRFSLSWFGIFAMGISVFILAFANQGDWYIVFMMVMDIIGIIYASIIMFTQNTRTLVN